MPNERRYDVTEDRQNKLAGTTSTTWWAPGSNCPPHSLCITDLPGTMHRPADAFLATYCGNSTHVDTGVAARASSLEYMPRFCSLPIADVHVEEGAVALVNRGIDPSRLAFKVTYAPPVRARVKNDPVPRVDNFRELIPILW